MNGVFIIPTGLGFEIGGHAGDSNPAARLIAGVSDKLIVHPNVVNASDLNEMTDNMLYVEGSMLDRFLTGDIYLQEVHSNRILVVVNGPVQPETINTVSAARAILGLEIAILVLKTPLLMEATIGEDGAGGVSSGEKELITQVQNNETLQFFKFDALAIATHIDLDPAIELNYFENGGINPWGGIEAQVSRYISSQLDKPVAHAPGVLPKTLQFKGIVDPRVAAEMISPTSLYCVLKGLHKAPQFSGESGLHVSDIDFIISPWNCYGKPHVEAHRHGIPIILVKGNQHLLEYKQISFENQPTIVVENYLEAAGVITAMKEGISLESLTRPLEPTKVQ